VGHSENRCGILLWTFCFQYLVSKGYIDGQGRATGKPFPARLTSVGEPGGKVRVPTITLACLVGYLQPYAHTMRGVLEFDPTLSSGLSSANQAYEFAKRFKHMPMLTEGILLGDLEEATNWISHEVGNQHMESFLEGLAEGRRISDYVRNAHTLFLNPLLLSYDGEEYLTCNGAPMGLPGTKILLHSLGKAIDKMAEEQSRALRPQELRLSRYANAGDDIMKPGPLSVLRRHKTSALRYKVKPSEDKWGIYKVGGPYCEEMCANGGTCLSYEQGILPFKVDSIRGRLLSSETKPKTGDEDTNPTFGKGRQLGRELEWCPPRFHALAFAWFGTNFRDFGDCRLLMAIPHAYGGFGFPMPLEERLNLIPEQVRRWIQYCWEQRGTQQSARALRGLRMLTRPLLFDRGERLEMGASFDEDPISSVILDVIGCRLEDIESVQNIRYHSSSPRFWDRIKAVKRLGYVDSAELHRYNAPYWERKPVPTKGWATAPLSIRLRRVERFFSEVKLPEGPFNPLALEAKAHELMPPKVFFKPEQAMIFLTPSSLTEVAGMVTENIMRKGMGMSLNFRIPSSNILFGLGSDE